MTQFTFLTALIWTARYFEALKHQKHSITNQEFIESLPDYDDCGSVYMYCHRATRRTLSVAAFIVTECRDPWLARPLGFKNTPKFVYSGYEHLN
jgi:hypothetical protein